MRTNKFCDFDSLTLTQLFVMKEDFGGFLIFVVITAALIGTGMNNRLQDHGYKVCSQLPSSSFDKCYSINKKESAKQFTGSFILALLISGSFWWLADKLNTKG